MYFYGKTDKDALSYKAGQTAIFTLTLREDGRTVFPRGTVKFRIEADGTREIIDGSAPADVPVTIKCTCEVPGFVRVTARLFADDGSEYNGCGAFDGGAGFDVLNIRPAAPPPTDICEFREKLARIAESVEPKLIEKKELPSKRDGFRLFDVKIACASPTPASGYLTIPCGNEKLRCKVGYKGYGVNYPEPEYEDGTAYLFTNAHGFENGRQPEYYAELASGALKDYGMSKDENARPETSYFFNMIIRAVAALKFMTTLDRWNGADLIAYGGSQGGMQAMNAASYVNECSYCDVFVPWMCDTAAQNVGRIRYASPAYAAGLSYFDGTNVAKFIKCKTDVRAGLGDYTCQPSGIMAMFNELTCEKTIVFTQNMIHTSAEPEGSQYEIRIRK